MPRNLFLNLPVADLAASIRFFTDLGFAFNPQFTDETAACMIISEANYAMLLTREKFAAFTPRQICDAKSASEVLIALSCDHRAEVDDMMSRALAGGGSEIGEAKDHGFMYHRAFADLDGHIWETFWMDMQAAPSTQEKA